MSENVYDGQGPTILPIRCVCVLNVPKKIFLTFEVAVWALLQADGQVRDAEVGRGARQTRVLSGAGARLAGLVAGQAGGVLGEVAPRGAARDAGTVRAKRAIIVCARVLKGIH